MKLLDKVANVAIILGVAVFLFVVVRGEFRTKTPPHPPASMVGNSIKVPGLKLSSGRGSLLIAISTTCHFCQESMPFYKQLVSQAKSKVDTVAIMPQQANEAEAFLRKSDVQVDKVISTDLTTIGVLGTPTLFLVDAQGKVKQQWIGELSEDQKKQVLAQILQS